MKCICIKAYVQQCKEVEEEEKRDAFWGGKGSGLRYLFAFTTHMVDEDSVCVTRSPLRQKRKGSSFWSPTVHLQEKSSHVQPIFTRYQIHYLYSHIIQTTYQQQSIQSYQEHMKENFFVLPFGYKGVRSHYNDAVQRDTKSVQISPSTQTHAAHSFGKADPSSRSLVLWQESIVLWLGKTHYMCQRAKPKKEVRFDDHS